MAITMADETRLKADLSVGVFDLEVCLGNWMNESASRNMQTVLDVVRASGVSRSSAPKASHPITARSRLFSNENSW